MHVTPSRYIKALIIASLVICSDAASAGSFMQYQTGNARWSGPYLGLFGGGGTGTSSINTSVSFSNTSSNYFDMVEYKPVAQNATGSDRTSAFLGGVEIGNNWQSGILVAGLAVDFGSFFFRNTVKGVNVSYKDYPAQYTVQASLESHWLFTARGRLGITPRSGKVLFYVTGGYALTDLRVANAFADNDRYTYGVGGAEHDQTKSGWTAGGGIEVALNDNWSLTGEYLYTRFNKVDVSGGVGCSPAYCTGYVSPFNSTADLSANNFRVGMNVNFA